MSTILWIEAITEDEITKNKKVNEGSLIEFGEEFLWDFFVNQNLLSAYLTDDEIRLISPNWGDIELKSTDTLSAVDKEKYLLLLRDVMKTNSAKELDKFLFEKGITSFQLRDRAKSPEEVLRITEKLMSALKVDNDALKFFDDLDRLLEFLKKAIEQKNKITIEFID